MSAKLDPDLLRACAACLAHAHVYRLDEAGALSMLRPLAAAVVAARGWPESEGDTPPPERCDELTRLHLEAIRRWGRSSSREVRSGEVMFVGVDNAARAILDAPPSLLAWWCERLKPPPTREAFTPER